MVQKLKNIIFYESTYFFIFSFINAVILSIYYFSEYPSIINSFQGEYRFLDQLYLSFYAFTLAVCLAVFTYILILIFCFILHVIRLSWLITHKHVIFFVVTLINILLFSYAIVDSSVFKTLGLRLSSPSVIHTLTSDEMQAQLHLTWDIFVLIGVVIIGIIIISILLLFLLKKVIKRPFFQQRIIAISTPFIFLTFCGISLSLLTTIIQSSITQNAPILHLLPAYEYLFEQIPSSESLTLNYPLSIKKTPLLKKKKTILYILSESYRNDIFTPEISPNIMKYRKAHNCIVSNNHHSGALYTEYGVFSFLYALDIHHFDHFMKEKRASFPLQLLKNNGWQLFGASASSVANWNKETRFMFDIFDKYKEFSSRKYYPDRDKAMLKWIEKAYATRDKTKPSLFYLFTNSTHHNYYYPKEFEKFKPAAPFNFKFFKYMKTKTSKKTHNEVFNRYKNSALYTDYIFKQLTELFHDEIEKDELIIVVSGDHGEEFWDNGRIGHGKYFVNARSNVPMMLCLPGVGEKKLRLTSHTDILPTIIDYLQPEPPLSSNQYSNGLSLIRPLPDNRYIMIGSYGFPRKNRELSLIDEKGKLLLKKTTDKINRHNFFHVLHRKTLKDRPMKENKKHFENLLDRYKIRMLRFFK